MKNACRLPSSLPLNDRQPHCIRLTSLAAIRPADAQNACRAPLYRTKINSMNTSDRNAATQLAFLTMGHLCKRTDELKSILQARSFAPQCERC